MILSRILLVLVRNTLLGHLENPQSSTLTYYLPLAISETHNPEIPKYIQRIQFLGGGGGGGGAEGGAPMASLFVHNKSTERAHFAGPSDHTLLFQPNPQLFGGSNPQRLPSNRNQREA